MRLFSLQPSACLVWYFLGCTALLGTFFSDAIVKVASARDITWQDVAFGHPRNNIVVTNVFHEFSKSVFSSDWGFLLLVNFLVSAYAFLGVMTTVIFLGQLSVPESRRLTERLAKHLVFKVVFVGAVMKPEFQKMVLWLVWFAVTAFLKMFVGAAKDRLESLMGYAHPLPTKHLRAMVLLLLLLAMDAASIVGFWSSRPVLGWTYFLLFAFDTAIIAVEGIKTLVHYGIYLLDLIVAWESAPESLGTWEAWDGKGSFLYHTELVADVLMHLMTLLHYLQIWFLHGLTFHVVDAILFLDVRSIMMSMHKRMRGYSQYRAANHNLNHSFPDAAQHDLSHPCAICMEGMTAGKKLPCGHVFHLACLRAWLQQSSSNFTCPMCRKPLCIPQGPRGAAGAAPLLVLPPFLLPLVNSFDRLLTLLFPGFFSVPWSGYENHMAWVLAEARRREERARRLAAREEWVTSLRGRIMGWVNRNLGRELEQGAAGGAARHRGEAAREQRHYPNFREQRHYPAPPARARRRTAMLAAVLDEGALSDGEVVSDDSDSLNDVSTWTGSTVSAAMRSLSCSISVTTQPSRGVRRLEQDAIPEEDDEDDDDDGGEVTSRPSPSAHHHAHTLPQPQSQQVGPSTSLRPSTSAQPTHRYPIRRHTARC